MAKSYFLLLALVVVGILSCGKDEDEEKDPREALVGTYEVTADIVRIQSDLVGNKDTTYTNDTVYFAIISLPEASDTLKDNQLIVSYLDASGDKAIATLTEDLLKLEDYYFPGSTYYDGIGTVNNGTITLDFVYTYPYFRAEYSIVAVKRN